MFDYEVTYTYLTTDLRYNTILAELNVSGVQYSHKLSDVGTMQGSIYLDPALDHEYLQNGTHPAHTGIYVLRNEVPVWGGIIWKRSYDSSNGRLQIQARTFESYYEKVVQLENLTFTGRDQFEIAQRIVAGPNKNVGISIDNDARSAVTRDRTMLRTDYNTVLKELQDLSNLLDGFDFNVSVEFNTDGTFLRRLDLAYPELGVSKDATPYVFEYPGNISAFSMSEDADSGANYVIAVGETDQESGVAVEASATDSDELGFGWPPMQATHAYSSVTQVETLQGHANADLKRLKQPVVLYTTTVRADQDPQVGSYRVGDWARFRIDNEWISPILDAYARITEYSVTVDDKGGPESVTLTLGGGDIGARGAA